MSSLRKWLYRWGPAQHNPSRVGFRDSGFRQVPARVARAAQTWAGRWKSVGALVGLLFLGLAVELPAQEPASEEGRSRFCAVDIFVDSGSTPLAAYQVRFAVTNGVARIAGIEGGDHPAFRQPPFYDPKAIQNEVAILASFNTASAANLPKGKTRVATIHLQSAVSTKPQFELTLQTAADTQGNKITCVVSFEERIPQ